MSSNPAPSARTPGTATPTGTHGSQTVLQTNTAGPSAPSATLRLRAEPDEAPRVRWSADVIDNEGMGKKSSKVCCIYHKPHQPGESDSESDSSSSSGSDSEPDLSRAQRAGGKGKRGRRHGHEHGHGGDGEGEGKGKARRASPNAYERQPKYKSKK